MKKLLAIFLALVMMLSIAALAEEPLDAAQSVADQTQVVYDELVVGSTTALSGSFFTGMWGSNASDADVKQLLHGYNLMEWEFAMATFGIAENVVSGIVVTENLDGDRTYTIALYDDLKYSDGTPITAYDYAFAILLSVAPEVAAIGGQTTGSDYLLGVDAYKAGETEVLSGVRVLGDYQLSITVKAEYMPFFYELGLLDYCPYPIAVIAPGCEVADDGEGVYIRNIREDEEETAEETEEAAEVEEEPIFTAELLKETILNSETGYLSHPAVVSGPYTLTSFDWATRTAEFALNENYKGNSAGVLPTIPKLVYRTVSNETMIEELKNGEVDLLNKCVNADALDAGMQLISESEGAYSVANYPRSGHSFISFSCEDGPVSSQSVRQAIAWCLDKDTVVSDYVRNYGMRVDGYYGIGQWMVGLLNGTIAAPIEELGEEPAEDATEEEKLAYEEAKAAYEAETAAWAEMSMDAIPTYSLDLDKAVELLVADGWTLNAAGAEFNPETDDVRCKDIGGEIVALDLKMIYPAGNAIGESLPASFIDNLAKVGIKLTAEPVAMTDLLEIYYRNAERDVDMIYLATNFDTVFDPSSTFNPEDAYQGYSNRTGIADQDLYDLAVAMRQTESGNVLEYCQKWLAFQQKYAEVLPTIPVYSNVYFDFYSSTLHDYDVSANLTWTQAVVGAYLGDYVVEEEAVEEEMEIVAEEAEVIEG